MIKVMIGKHALMFKKGTSDEEINIKTKFKNTDRCGRSRDSNN